MENDFLDFFSQTVTIEPWTGQDVYAEATYGAAVSYPSHVEKQTQMVRNAQGQEVVSTAQAFLPGTAVVITKDRITLPGGAKPLILSVEEEPDETGQTHHVVVYT